MTNETTVSARERVTGDVAAALGIGPGELTDDTNLLDAGLDSVRIMALIEKWRRAGHEDLDLPVLAEDPVLGSWIALLE
ncbi:phosphopantetheine-binding protein [Nocardia jiangsuensis]|uniref:Phosphopantetheine-binding protein n=1 Tax=Nocardia jiangsuensis TaxID=1691563 RepID=A0ABV8E0R7_9NOCA